MTLKDPKYTKGIYVCPVCDKERKCVVAKYQVGPDGYVKPDERYRLCRSCSQRRAMAVTKAKRKASLISKASKEDYRSSHCRKLKPEEVDALRGVYLPPNGGKDLPILPDWRKRS